MANSSGLKDKEGKEIREGSQLINPVGYERWVVYYSPTQEKWRAFLTSRRGPEDRELKEVAHLFILSRG